MKKVVKERRAKGLCVRCGVNANGKYLCEAHTAEKNERQRAAWKKRYDRNPITSWCTRIVGRIRRRLTGKQRELAITAKDLVEVFPKGLSCPVFGRRFVFGRNSPWNPSVDRLDATKGYEPGNVVIISVRANTLKNNATADELQLVANWLRCKETPREVQP